jgi:hypothetical protein
VESLRLVLAPFTERATAPPEIRQLRRVDSRDTPFFLHFAAPRTSVRGPAFVNVDFALAKNLVDGPVQPRVPTELSRR